jgi:hypothetical protein
MGDRRFPILRNDLGDFEERDWPNGKDPWAFTIIAAMKDDEGVLLKFSTSAKGGENAIRILCRDWRRQRDKHPGMVPVIKLGSDSYLHKIHRTEVIIPTFAIVGWAAWDDNGDLAVVSAPKALPPGGVTADDPRTMMGPGIDDEIIF